MQTNPSLFIAGVLVGGFIFGHLARMVIPGEQRLTWSETTLGGIAGAAVVGFIANLLREDTGPTAFGWETLLGAFAGTLFVLGVVSIAMNRFGLRPEAAGRPSTASLVSAGENHQVEFKATARWNLYTEDRDSKVELAIAKTIAGFLNADGGTLLIGIADDGSPVGLDADLSLMKSPDLDRYQLRLIDHLERCLGKPAVANVTVTFALVGTSQVCRADVEASPSPVFLDEPGGNRDADMYVRMATQPASCSPMKLSITPSSTGSTNEGGSTSSCGR